MAAIAKLKLLSSRRAGDVPTAAALTAAGADEDDLPIPSDIKAVFLGALSSGNAWSLLYRVRYRIADCARVRAQPRAAAGDAGTRTGPFAPRDCGCVPHSHVVRHARRVGRGAVGTRGQLGGEAAHRGSQTAGAPELSEPADRGRPKIRRPGARLNPSGRSQAPACGGAGRGTLREAA